METIAVDREGKTAALYSPSQKTLQLLKGLPDRPEVFLSTVLSDAAATVTALALLPLESGALIAAGGPLQGGVFRLNSDGALVLVAETGLVRSLAVLGPDAFVYADAARNELVQVRGAGAGAERRVLAGASDQVNDPRGVCVLDGGGLILANGAGKLLLTFDSDGRPTGSLAVEFTPGRCDAMGRGALLQLNDAGRGPLYLLDYSESLRTMFVPASPSPEVRQ